MQTGPLDLNLAQGLFTKYRTERTGISDVPEMQYVCLICGSVHIERVSGDQRKWVCRNCGFGFQRYACAACGLVIDSRDPSFAKCTTCNGIACSCGACNCKVELR
ncbi:MAG TPA: hypothetical protein VIV60_16920 [Polyangiaceae bacterium]